MRCEPPPAFAEPSTSKRRCIHRQHSVGLRWHVHATLPLAGREELAGWARLSSRRGGRPADPDRRSHDTGATTGGGTVSTAERRAPGRPPSRRLRAPCPPPRRRPGGSREFRRAHRAPALAPRRRNGSAPMVLSAVFCLINHVCPTLPTKAWSLRAWSSGLLVVEPQPGPRPGHRHQAARST